MKLILFHDAEALAWAPFVETRPVGEMLFGASTLRERAERALGTRASAYAGAPHLEGFDEAGSPPHQTIAATAEEDRVLLCVRAAIEPLASPLPSRTATLVVDGKVVGWMIPAGTAAPSAEDLRSLGGRRGETVPLGGELLARPWDLMAGNATRIAADATRETHGAGGSTLSGVHLIGTHRVLLGEGAAIEPGVTLDLRSGPVWLAAGARVEGPARVTGPLYLGARSTILGGPVSTSSIGPACKVRGEVADSVILGYCNKAHDGHLGHAVLGRWVNLGAGTTNSDLKNTYSSIRVRLPTGEVDTGHIKVGCFLGDHVKTGIATPINTGTIVGAGSNVFGGRMPPTYVPPFSWGEGSALDEYELERFLGTAEVVMRRRDVELTRGMRQVLTSAFESSRSERTVRKG